MKKNKSKRDIIALCLFVLSLVLIATGTTFAFFTYSKEGQTENKLESGTLTFVYDEKRSEKNRVSLTDAFPMTDAEGIVQTNYFEFEISAEAKGANINYEIYLTKEKVEGSTFPDDTVKTYLTTVEESMETGVPDTFNQKEVNLYSNLGDSNVPPLGDKEGKTLYQETILDGNTNYSKTFRFRMWIDQEANQVVDGNWIYNRYIFSVKVNVYAQNEKITSPSKPHIIPAYKDTTNANPPKLVEGMIPVVYDEEVDSWVKQDVARSYAYQDQIWANAVTIGLDADGSSKKREDYVAAAVGTPIKIEDINTMWVWIPRYEYDYVGIDNFAGGSEEQPGEININFLSGKSDFSSIDYLVHPAFTFGSDELTGFWYGKFETSNQEESYEENTSTLTPSIKPSIPSWRGINVSNAFYAALNMTTEENAIKYGFSSDGSIDTHMSKNSEWGAVAYLSQSRYGKHGNYIYSDNEKEVGINGCSNYITGSGATCNDNYTTENGQKASTTGNIMGVYDMNGGTNEYVMGALKNGATDKPIIGITGFTDDNNENTKIPDAKYYDLYTTDLDTSCITKGECYGHALSETAGWYGDSQIFVMSRGPWFSRGGSYSSTSFAGVFGFDHTGLRGLGGPISFHVMLAPLK